MENVKVALWGFGAMGSGIAKVLLRKKGVDIVGVCDIHPARVGSSIYELLEIDRGSRYDVLVNPKIEEVVHNGNCDICVIATDSFTRKAFNKIKFVVEQNVNVVSTAEEMSFPMAQEPELSAEMDKLAKEHGVSILGTGINPGLMMDLLAICLSGCMTDVEKVTCRRVNSLSPFGPAVMEEKGDGKSVNDFNTGVENGTLAGHVGFAESVTLPHGHAAQEDARARRHRHQLPPVYRRFAALFQRRVGGQNQVIVHMADGLKQFTFCHSAAPLSCKYADSLPRVRCSVTRTLLSVRPYRAAISAVASQYQ